ncbi:MAG: SdpI family protein [Eubacteriales bacterium]|nr:SdpI family protein [Eubacteriales bacterium]
MAYWIFMFFMVLLIPGIMVGVGLWFRRCPPGKINYLFGYRTALSMKNQDTWDFAQKKCAQVWLRWGPRMLVCSAIAMLPVFGRSTDTVGAVGGLIVLLQLIPLLASIHPVEKALRETFDKDGNRKQ